MITVCTTGPEPVGWITNVNEGVLLVCELQVVAEAINQCPNNFRAHFKHARTMALMPLMPLK